MSSLATLDVPRVPESSVLGATEPRIFTPPLRELTPETTVGYAVIEFAEEILGVELLPYQKWWLLHALELRADGRFRFRTIVTLISRQNGKTFLLKVLSLFFLYVRGHRDKVLVLGSAQNIPIAKEAWEGAVQMAQEMPDLAAEVARNGVRYVNGEQSLTLRNGSRYRIVAATRGAGRGMSVDLLILDELREHRNWEAWGALTKTTTARPNALIVGISNAGDDESVVLNSLRSTALAGTDDTIGLFEWSAPDGCELDDVQAWATANPGLGRTVSQDALRSAMNTDPVATFRTENLCQRVDALDAAVDLASWKATADPSANLGSVRERVAACVDVAPDGAHVTLAGAAVLDDGRVRVEVLAAWKDTASARRDLPGLLARIRPAAFGWFPSGPAAALGADLRTGEPIELKGAEVSELCQEFADLVLGRRVLHSDDPLLNSHVGGTAKLRTGDGWRFSRKGSGHVDAAYAAAGAVRIARTLPPPTKRVRANVF